MTNVMDAYTYLDGMTEAQILQRRSAIIGSAPNGDYKQLSDEDLQELVAIHRVLRRKTSTSVPRASRKGADMVPSLDNI